MKRILQFFAALLMMCALLTLPTHPVGADPVAEVTVAFADDASYACNAVYIDGAEATPGSAMSVSGETFTVKVEPKEGYMAGSADIDGWPYQNGGSINEFIFMTHHPDDGFVMPNAEVIISMKVRGDYKAFVDDSEVAPGADPEYVNIGSATMSNDTPKDLESIFKGSNPELFKGCQVDRVVLKDTEGNETSYDRSDAMDYVFRYPTTISIYWHRHELVKTDAVAATCENAGNTEYYVCSKCGEWFSDSEGENEIGDHESVEIEATGHSLGTIDAIEADCEFDGNTEYYICDVCNRWFSDAEGTNEITDHDSVVVKARGHSLTRVEAVDATCEKDGNTEYFICDNCNRWFSDSRGTVDIEGYDSVVIPATGHKWGKWTVTKDPSETEEGVETRTCENDKSHTQTRAIPKLKPGKVTFTITYDLAGGTLNGRTGKVTEEAEEGSTITLPAPTRSGYSFDCWEGSSYAAGASYKVTGDHTFTARWKANSSSPSPSGSSSGGRKSGTTTAKSPRTGDETNAMLWALMMLLSLGLIVSVATGRHS